MTTRQDELLARIESGRLRIEPEHRRNEVLRFVDSGLADFSVSRPVERARRWGLPVPEDPSQVIYVWFDALANYITALDYGVDGDAFRIWWEDAEERVHVIGKGILRFHAVYWPAILLSAQQSLPTAVFVADDLGNLINRTSPSSAGSGPRAFDRRACCRKRDTISVRRSTARERRLRMLSIISNAAPPPPPSGRLSSRPIDSCRRRGRGNWRRRRTRTIALHRILSTAYLRCCFLLAE